MKTHIISSSNVRMLRDIQVAFYLEGGMVVLEQVETLSQFCDEYLKVDLIRIGESDKSRLEHICAEWYNAQPKKDQFNNDDPNPAA